MAKTAAHRAKAIKDKKLPYKPYGPNSAYDAAAMTTGKEYIAVDEYISLDAYEVYETVQGVIRNAND